MNFFKKEICIILISLIFLLVGCSGTETETGEAGKIYTDTLGREVLISQTPEKVVSLSPAITEILFALEQDDKIVGTTDYCDYPEAALNKPKVGNFENPNLELIVASEPDLVFVAAGVQSDLIDKFEELGIKVFCLDAETLEEVIRNIELTGQIMGAEDIAQNIAQDMRARMNNVIEKVKGLDRPLVFYEVWDDPLMSAGPGSFIDDLINLAGGENLAKDAASRYPQINFEVVVERNPDIYIAVNHYKENEIIARPSYDSLKAVQTGNVYTIEDDLVTLPGPRIIIGLEQMAKIIHPEVFN